MGGGMMGGRGRAMPRMGGPVPFGNQFSTALNTMNDLINEYNDLNMDNLEDLNKLDIQEVARKIFKALRERDYSGFTQIIGILEKELKK